MHIVRFVIQKKDAEAEKVLPPPLCSSFKEKTVDRHLFSSIISWNIPSHIVDIPRDAAASVNAACCVQLPDRALAKGPPRYSVINVALLERKPSRQGKRENNNTLRSICPRACARGPPLTRISYSLSQWNERASFVNCPPPRSTSNNAAPNLSKIYTEPKCSCLYWPPVN